MSNNVQDPTDSVKSADTPMDTQEHTDKGKGKAIEPEAMSEDDDDEESAEEGEGEPEEADEDNMEEIDTDNIVPGRTRGKAIDYAEAAKQLPDDDEDDEDDEDFQEDDAMEE
ncbi:hypothetical protein TI39_contig517g00011 [Zymoseptoria brevis]|uniref:Histone chaperone domain-containing protein n=1 Tax=Zymoseptoria brevis TaxID=1047168 RepID=A0A0F4GJL1_9PEZI|nr:hypothetical protein TI39_contig517g00011 [Zymoseptoria brevis]